MRICISRQISVPQHHHHRRLCQVVVAADTRRDNTVCALEGYVNWSAGFAVSASRRGCFPYRDVEGRTRYFDISLYDPSCHPSTYLLD